MPLFCGYFSTNRPWPKTLTATLQLTIELNTPIVADYGWDCSGFYGSGFSLFSSASERLISSIPL